MKEKDLIQAYQIAKDRYAELGVNVEAAMEKLERIPVSMHCWQGDDVGGYETVGAELTSGGIQATGNYPGQGSHHRRAARRHREGSERDSRPPPAQPARLLPG